PRGLALAVVDVEPHASCWAPVERPGAVLQAPRADVVDCLAESIIGGSGVQSGGRAEIVERSEHVVVPSIRVQEVQESLVGRLTRAEAAEERPLQEVLLARAAGCPRFRSPAGGALVLQEPVQHVDRGGERRADRAVLSLAVPPAVLEALP